MTSAKYRKKDLIVFDLDGTLTPSKSNLESDVSDVLAALLAKKKIAVIGGGTYRQFKKQFIAEFRCPPALFKNLFLFPTTATAFYRYHHGWRRVYAFMLSRNESREVREAFADVLREIHYVPPLKTYGKVIENRGSQVTFSALGQDVVAVLGKRGLRLKEEWKRKNTPLKFRIAKLVQGRLPKLEVRASAYTSIDVTKKGIDKAYGIRQIEKTLRIPVKKMLFIGDGLYRGGNDAAAKRTGVDCIAVRGPADTIKVIKDILKAG
jgi:phosphomannomutase